MQTSRNLPLPINLIYPSEPVGFEGVGFDGLGSDNIRREMAAQGDLSKTTYRSAMSTIPQLYSKGGLGVLYKGGLARTGRLCGAFFIVNTLRDYAMRYKAYAVGDGDEAAAAAGVGFFGR